MLSIFLTYFLIIGVQSRFSKTDINAKMGETRELSNYYKQYSEDRRYIIETFVRPTY
jgi:hypothetical protein